MINLHTLTHTTIVGNELWRIMMLFLTILGTGIIGRMANRLLSQNAARMQKNGKSALWPALMQSLAQSADILALAFGLQTGAGFLNLTDPLDRIVTPATGVLFVCAVAFTAYCLVDVIDAWLKSMADRTHSKLDNMLIPMVRKSIRITIIILALLQIATILSDKPVTSLLAGIGLGSLAVALAAQETIKNFFGSLVIFADKPFEIGQRIVVDGHDGVVEEVGFRSTRVRTLDGHLVVFPNGELANKSIRNIGRRLYIRRLFNIDIKYDTPPEKAQQAVTIIRELLDNHEGMRPDLPPRVFFDEFNKDTLNIRVCYWYHPPDFWASLAFAEKFNLELLRSFNEAGIEFAFPTQTIHIAKDMPEKGSLVP